MANLVPLIGKPFHGIPLIPPVQDEQEDKSQTHGPQVSMITAFEARFGNILITRTRNLTMYR